MDPYTTLVKCKTLSGKEFNVMISHLKTPYPHRILRSEVASISIYEIQEAMVDVFDKYESVMFEQEMRFYPNPSSLKEGEKSEPITKMVEFTVYNFLITALSSWQTNPDGKKIPREDIYVLTYNIAWEDEIKEIDSNPTINITRDKRKDKPITYKKSSLVDRDGNPIISEDKSDVKEG